MDKKEEKKVALGAFQEALLCNPSVYTWHYSADGSLLDTNCEYNVYKRVFEHTGCFAYMLEKGKEESTPLILSAALGILWCSVYDPGDGEDPCFYMIGPVFHTEVNTALLNEAIDQYEIDPAWRRFFVKSMQDIPSVSSILFFQYAVMLYYFVTGKKITRGDIRFQVKAQELSGTKAERAGRGEKKNSVRSRHQTYQVEQVLLQLIRDGDLNYERAMERAGQISSGVSISTRDPVNRAILSASNFTALCTRAAIDGGITPDTAYTVGDSYLQSLTECKTISDVRTINHTMYEDFIRRVNREKNSLTYSRQVKDCMSYIETHLEEELSLELLSREVGYSEYHLSRKFKAETGKNIREYIRHVRIERAKLLLGTTDLSIRDISERLLFCAPSHFSRIFKEETGVLPAQYRKEHYK